MKKFLVLYCMPSAGLAEWMKKPEAERKAEEGKMQSEWGVWMQKNARMVKETAGAGKTN